MLPVGTDDDGVVLLSAVPVKIPRPAVSCLKTEALHVINISVEDRAFIFNRIKASSCVAVLCIDIGGLTISSYYQPILSQR